MRVAIVTESFLPQINGVTNSVCRVLEHLARRGDDAVVVAPGHGTSEYAGHPVVGLPSVSLPGNDDSVVAISTRRRIGRILRDFAPDVVHLASPAWLGRAGMSAAKRLGLPTVAVFQTDLAGFARGYRFWRTLGDDAIWAWLRRIHDQADRTLAPSTATLHQLADKGFTRLNRWGRGVDLARFSPAHRDEALRRKLAPGGETLIGYVGRLAPEKEVASLTALRSLPGARLVIVGGGPSEPLLRHELPDATFLGFRTGDELSRIYAALDVFVHTGPTETFCQAVQEALASGVPAVAPRAGGPIDLITPGRTGDLYDPGDDSDLAAAVSRIIADPVRRREMAVAARASVLGRSWTSVCDELLGHYADVVALGAATTPKRASA